jgi:hypothetical protein
MKKNYRFSHFYKPTLYKYVGDKEKYILQHWPQFGAISVVKYIYIFIQKNPTGRNDDFWFLIMKHCSTVI